VWCGLWRRAGEGGQTFYREKTYNFLRWTAVAVVEEGPTTGHSRGWRCFFFFVCLDNFFVAKLFFETCRFFFECVQKIWGTLRHSVPRFCFASASHFADIFVRLHRHRPRAADPRGADRGRVAAVGLAGTFVFHENLDSFFAAIFFELCRYFRRTWLKILANSATLVPGFCFPSASHFPDFIVCGCTDTGLAQRTRGELTEGGLRPCV
jgi:hypothetical protein